MEREPELNAECRRLYLDFIGSAEHVALGQIGPPRWLESFLDIHSTCEWTIDGLDPSQLNAALFDGMGWTIDAPPDDPAAVARELLAFLRWAKRTGIACGDPEYDECCVYLASPEAAVHIGQWLVPIEFTDSPYGCDCCRMPPT